MTIIVVLFWQDAMGLGFLVADDVSFLWDRYCQRIPSSNFWGGESELLVSVDSPSLYANSLGVDMDPGDLFL